ncbi:cobalt ECF transporter T component CbiQ [bacterium]|nr:MAG: cobalt ECF transporter T component CbiQ [bacterium]
MEHSYFDEYSSMDSFIHRLEPRIKAIAFFALIIFIVLAPQGSFFILGAYTAVVVFCIFLSRIPLAVFLRRSFTALPFIAAMSLFILFARPGRPLWAHSFGPLHLSISYEGLTGFFNILLKAYLCILCALLLAFSTNFIHLLKALEKLKVPSIFIMVVSFMYRYLFILQDELEHMKQAKESRTVGGSRWFHARALANMLGVLFVRTYERAEEVYLAMCARGFDGTVKTIYDFKIKPKDVYFLLAVISFLFLARVGA